MKKILHIMIALSLMIPLAACGDDMRHVQKVEAAPPRQNETLDYIETAPETKSGAESLPAPTLKVKPVPTPAPTLDLDIVFVPEPETELTPESISESTPSTMPESDSTPSPTDEPTLVPTTGPTPAPTSVSTTELTPAPTSVPTTGPTPAPTPVSTVRPTPAPTPVSTARPTPAPTLVPTVRPTPVPTILPIVKPVQKDPVVYPNTEYMITDRRVKTWVSTSGTIWAVVMVEITNTSRVNLYLSSGAFDLEDSEGNLVDTCSWVPIHPSVIAPGEKAYMYERFTLERPNEDKLTVFPRVDVEEATVPLIRYEITDTKLYDENGELKILGRVKNTGPEAESMVHIVAYLYDAKGNFIEGLSTCIFEELQTGEKIGFELNGLNPPEEIAIDSVASIVYYAYPTQIQ